jgi:F-type H+-transporting ATPase subunit delta
VIRDAAAKRYAEAAFLAAREEGTEAAWLQALEAMAALFGSPEAEAFFAGSRVPPSQKTELVERALAGAHPHALNLARLLLRRGRAQLAAQIKEAFQQLLDEARGISHATVISAVTLSPDEIKAVADRLSEMTGGQVIAHPQVDESIIGGLVVRIGDRVIDGSTRARLQQLKEELAGARS